MYYDTSFVGMPKLGDQIHFKAMAAERATLQIGQRVGLETSMHGVSLEGEVLGLMGNNVTLRVDQITDQRT